MNWWTDDDGPGKPAAQSITVSTNTTTPKEGNLAELKWTLEMHLSNEDMQQYAMEPKRRAHARSMLVALRDVIREDVLELIVKGWFVSLSAERWAALQLWPLE